MACSCTDEIAAPEPTVASSDGVERYLPELSRLWSLTRGSAEVCVAILDGPIDGAHPCFEGANLKQLQSHSATGCSRGMPLLHGTHVSSLIFGQHSSPFRGVAPLCRGVVIPVFDEREDGSLIPCSQLDLARAISLAVAVGADVINISGGRNDPTGQPEPILARALDLCARQGILIIAAAGNDGCRCLHVPAAAPTVLAVGALDRNGQPWESSNWGDLYRNNGLLAPGEDILGAVPGGGLASFSGTSLAAALASGVAALLVSVQRAAGQKKDARAVRNALIHGASHCRPEIPEDCSRLLAGRLNIAHSLTLLLQGDPYAMTTENQPVELVANRGEESSPPGSNAPDYERPTAGAAAPWKPARSYQNPPPEEPRRTAEGSSCGGTAAPQLVYALGLIDYDFGTEARRDAFVQRGLTNPLDHQAMLEHLEANPWDALGMTWTLVQEATPIYAIQPAGAFAGDTHRRLRELLSGQLHEGVTQVSIPGIIGPTTPLINGQRVPIIFPDIRGMCSWSTTALIEAVLGSRPDEGLERDSYDQQAEEIANFLDRVYYELSNLGVAPQERAVNYAATNLYQVAAVYKEAIQEDLRLDRIEVERSSACRPGSDCWDVKLTIFDPKRRMERAKEIFRLAVDVSETLPVTVGRLRRWFAF